MAIEAHLSLLRGRHNWLWGCSRCGAVFLSTPPGERPKECPEECPSCGARIDREAPQ